MAIRKVISEDTRRRMGTPAFAVSLIVGAVVVVVGTFFIGKSDSGQINVAATIQNSNQMNTDAQGDPANNVGVVPEALRNMPNGGLVPAENQDVPPPPVAPEVEENATTTATTTDEVVNEETEPATTEAGEGEAPAEDTQTAEPTEGGQ